jgi:hypothetical protein
MASPAFEQALPADSLPRDFQNASFSAVNNSYQPVANASLNLQVQDSTASQQSSDRVSSEHTRIRPGVEDDRILPLPSSQENGRPPLTAQSASWQSKHILTLGEQSMSEKKKGDTS